MANTTIQVKKSGISGNTPVSLNHGELAINYADKKLYFKDDTDNISYITNQDSFATINANSSLILATSPSDILSIVPGNNITITTDTFNKSITINSTASGGGGGGGSITFNNLSIDRQVHSATAGQTVFAITYTSADVIITINGATIDPSEYTAVDGTSITLATPAEAGDIVDIVGFTNTNNAVANNLVISNTSQSTSTTTGALQVAGGVGIQGNVFVGQTITFPDNSVLSSAILYDAFARLNSNAAFSKANSSGVIAQAAFDYANTIISDSGIDQFARNTANSASSNTIILQGVVETQNTSIEYGISQAQGAYIEAINAQESANSALLHAQGAYNTANTNAINIVNIEGIDSTQNTNISNLNTYATAAFNKANTNASDITNLQGVNLTQNTNISSANNLAAAAFNKANTGGIFTEIVTVNKDLYVGGNVYISGNATTLSSNNIVIDDSIIYVANNNPANLLDIGIVGNFTTDHYQHTGLIRDASDGVWKLFSNVASEPTTIVDFTDAIYDTIKVGSVSGNVVSNFVTINGIDLQSVNDTQNTSISIIQGVNTTQNNSISIIQGVNAGQNNRISTLESDFSTQNTRINNIESVNTTQNTSISIIQGVDNTQNTNITNAATLAQNAYDAANNALSSALAFAIALG